MRNMMLEKDSKERALAYWRERLGGELAELILPYDYSKTPVSNYLSNTYDFTIPGNINEKIKTFSYQDNVAPSTLIMTVFKILLHRYGNEEGICICTRLDKMQEIAVMRTQLRGDMTFGDALGEVGKVVQEAYEHQIPFAKLISEFGDQNLSTNQFFRVMINIQDIDSSGQETTGHQVEKSNSSYYASPIDLTLKVTKVNNELKCLLIYDKALFKNETIIRMAGHFNNLLEGVLTNPELPVSRIPMLTDQERHQLLVEWNKTTVDYPRNSSIDQIFEEQARLNPEKVALVYEDAEMTYRELDVRANQIANYLRHLNIEKEQLVAICLNRSPDMIASFLGVLKAGGAYVPFDLSYPKERIAYMLEDSGASFVITTESNANELPATRSKVISLDKEADKIVAQPNNSIRYSGAESLVYVMYTSGSTGKPKGVEVTHRGIVRLVKNNKYANFGDKETFLNRASVAFDVSTFEIYGSLLNGGKLVIMNSHKPTFEEIAKVIQQKQITTLRVGPDMLNLLLEDYSNYLGSLRQVFSGGEVLPVWLAQKFLSKLRGCQLINAYGPTENAVNTTTYNVKEILPNVSSIPIGRPISNDKVYILDEKLQPVPIGVPGELYMTGDGVARGYFNRVELTKERFISDPFSDNPEQKLYKSGDLARYRSNGNIEFIGRIDDQVKIRGNRIELGEVETIIVLFPGVRQSVAGAIRSNSGTNDLVAYVVMKKGVSFNQQKLRSYVKEKLPEAMIPTFFVELEEIPVTPVGKIDRKRLPVPIISVSEEIIPPRNEIEKQLVHIWEDLLDVNPIGITDHYFELGGNSLLAMQMFSEIERAFHEKLPVSVIFQEDTIEKLAEHLASKDQMMDTSTSLVPIQPRGSNPPLFCIHGGGGEVLVYRDLAIELGDEQPLYGLRYTNIENATRISVESLADKYIKELKEIQPTGPYSLLGYCFGGAIAYEMAQKLLEEGQEISLLTILNFANPKRQPVVNQNKINYGKVIKSNLKLLSKMPLKQRASFFMRRVLNAMKLVKNTPDLKLPEDGSAMKKAALSEAIGVYRPRPYSGKMLLIRANENKESEEKLGWQTTEDGKIYEYSIPVDHVTLLKKPSLETVVKYLKENSKMEEQ